MSASSPPRGAFIVIEGLDRSGKSTQAARLLDRIKSESSVRDTGSAPKAVLLKFPGESLRTALLNAITNLSSPPRHLAVRSSSQPDRDDDGLFATIPTHGNARIRSPITMSCPITPTINRSINPTPRPSDRTTAIGKMIDAYLRARSDLDDHAIHLLFAANRWELAPTILTHLAAGTTVVADRYAFSGIAFSAQKTSSDLTYEWCKAPEVGLPTPDLTLFLDVKPEVAMQRGGYGEERYEKQEVQMRVRRIFERIGDEMGHDRWVMIDAGQDRDDVAEAIWKSVVPVLESALNPMARLWQSQQEEC